MAIAAISVMAMRMTVANTGEMAFLFPLYTIFIVSCQSASLLIKGVWSFYLILCSRFEH
jgi:hypothetical protein